MDENINCLMPDEKKKKKYFFHNSSVLLHMFNSNMLPTIHAT